MLFISPKSDVNRTSFLTSSLFSVIQDQWAALERLSAVRKAHLQEACNQHQFQVTKRKKIMLMISWMNQTKSFFLYYLIKMNLLFPPFRLMLMT